MKSSNTAAITVSIEFALQPHKQCVLIDFIERYTALDDSTFCEMLGVSIEKFWSVKKQESTLAFRESSRLVEIFVMLCGN